jgi:crotonobetainyl-CoA:carnitine CoA-transferase CaiB-like acyl-CoA transferase
LRAEGIPSSLVLNFAEVLAHPQSQHRNMFPTLPHPAAGEHRVPGVPIKPAVAPTVPAPLLGQHTRQVLAEILHLDADAISALEAERVIYDVRLAAGPA